MSKASQQLTASKLRMEMSPTAKKMVCMILAKAINGIHDGTVSNGYDVGIVCAHLRCIMQVVHGEDEPFDMGLDGDATHPQLNKLLQTSVEDLDWKTTGGL